MSIALIVSALDNGDALQLLETLRLSWSHCFPPFFRERTSTSSWNIQKITSMISLHSSPFCTNHATTSAMMSNICSLCLCKFMTIVCKNHARFHDDAHSNLAVTSITSSIESTLISLSGTRTKTFFNHVSISSLFKPGASFLSWPSAPPPQRMEFRMSNESPSTPTAFPLNKTLRYAWKLIHVRTDIINLGSPARSFSSTSLPFLFSSSSHHHLDRHLFLKHLSNSFLHSGLSLVAKPSSSHCCARRWINCSKLPVLLVFRHFFVVVNFSYRQLQFCVLVCHDIHTLSFFENLFCRFLCSASILSKQNSLPANGAWRVQTLQLLATICCHHAACCPTDGLTDSQRCNCFRVIVFTPTPSLTNLILLSCATTKSKNRMLSKTTNTHLMLFRQYLKKIQKPSIHGDCHCPCQLSNRAICSRSNWSHQCVSVPFPCASGLHPSPHYSLCFSLVVHAFLVRPLHPNLPHIWNPFPTSLHGKSQRIISTERTSSSEKLVCKLLLPNSLPPLKLLSLLNFCHIRSFLELLFRNCDQKSIQHFPSFSTSLESWNNVIHSLLHQLHALHGGFRPLTSPLILLRPEIDCGHVYNGIQSINSTPTMADAWIHQHCSTQFVNLNH